MNIQSHTYDSSTVFQGRRWGLPGGTLQGGTFLEGELFVGGGGVKLARKIIREKVPRGSIPGSSFHRGGNILGVRVFQGVITRGDVFCEPSYA